MKQKVKLNHKSGPIEITIEGSDEGVLKYLKLRIEGVFGPVEENDYSDIDSLKSSFGEIFGKGFKKWLNQELVAKNTGKKTIRNLRIKNLFLDRLLFAQCVETNGVQRQVIVL